MMDKLCPMGQESKKNKKNKKNLYGPIAGNLHDGDPLPGPFVLEADPHLAEPLVKVLHLKATPSHLVRPFLHIAEQGEEVLHRRQHLGHLELDQHTNT